MSNRKLIVVSAPSGTGKTTIVKEILSKDKELVFSVSATTRKKRESESEGRDYFFISKEDFENKIKNNEFVEYECVFGVDYYGTLKSFIEYHQKENNLIIFDLDVLGALSIKKFYGDDAILIFIKPPSKESVINRLKGRGTEQDDDIERRIARFDKEMALIKEFNYIVTNDNLENAVKEIQKIINKYK
jgi:guanylate kinase